MLLQAVALLSLIQLSSFQQAAELSSCSSAVFIEMTNLHTFNYMYFIL